MTLGLILGGLVLMWLAITDPDIPSISDAQFERAMGHITEGVEEMGELQRESDRQMQEFLED